MNKKSLLTWFAAATLTLGMGLAAHAASGEDTRPVNLRAVGGANLGGTWNVGLAGLGKLVNDRYPGSAFNVLQGASTSNPLRLETGGGDITVTQGYNTFAAQKGQAPYKKPLASLVSLANIHDTSRFQIIISSKLGVSSFDELMEKKLPVKLDRGATGTLANELGKMLLAEYGYTYEDIQKWGGKVTSVSNNDLVGLMQDGSIDMVLKVGPGEQSQIQEMMLNTDMRWLTVSDKVLKAVAAKAGLQVGFVPAAFYGGKVGRDIPCLVDTSIIILRKGVSDGDAYKLAKSLAEGHEELAGIQPTWKTLKPESMATGMVLPLHPGAKKYYREAGLLK